MLSRIFLAAIASIGCAYAASSNETTVLLENRYISLDSRLPAGPLKHKALQEVHSVYNETAPGAGLAGPFKNWDFEADGPIRGVNIGGWLVLEPWIVPSLFEQFDVSLNVNDQWHFCKQLGTAACKQQLAAHWGSWFTQKDVTDIKAAGITHIRIPIGYWILGDIEGSEPWVTGDLDFLNAAIDWANDAGLKVVVDLHCGPGSQNGFDNSGHKGAIHWADYDSQGHLYNVERTVSVLTGLSKEIGNKVWGMEVLNEPFITIDEGIIYNFYHEAYKAIRANAPNVNILVSDAFRFGDTEKQMQPPTYQDVFMDTHIYQVFDAGHLKMSESDHMSQTCNQDRWNVANSKLWTVTGEWCLATTDCAKWLNGYNTGARYDGSFPGSSYIGSCTGRQDYGSFSSDYKNFLLEYACKQMDAYETQPSGRGWWFWNFKTEQAPQWNYLLGVEQGWIPKDHNNRPYKC